MRIKQIIIKKLGGHTREEFSNHGNERFSAGELQGKEMIKRAVVKVRVSDAESMSENALELMSSYVDYICNLVGIEPVYGNMTKYKDYWGK